MDARLRTAAFAGLVAAGLLAGCSIAVQNTEPARQLAREALPEGDVKIGWRVYQQKCAACHGVAATGSATAPDLLMRLREMGGQRFAALVLRRYDSILAIAESSPETTARSEVADRVVRGREGTLTMPAWQGDPAVTAHISDLYAYLAGRADGTQGTGRPR